jgi:uncharacterized protein
VRDRTERQQQVLGALLESDEPLTGTELAIRCGVTRQVVVHDIAILRAAGEPILSTPRGYCVQQPASNRYTTVLSVSHPPELTATELRIFVDHGVHILDVQVEHPIYGELRGALHLSSRRDVDLFLERIRNSSALLLSSLTDGYHIHTVSCSDLTRLTETVAALRNAGIKVLE